MKSRKIALLCILAGALLASPPGLIGCMGVPKNPYGLVDPYETDPTDSAKNNNSFAQASKIQLTNDAATFNAVLTVHDVDVYDLGSAAAGDRLIVDVDIPDRILLNGAVGIFDSQGRVYYLDEEITQIPGQPLTDANFPAWTPHFEFVVREATYPLYLAVASLPEPAPNGTFEGYTGGPYTVNVSFQRGGLPPQPVKQVVALQFSDAILDYPPEESFGQWSDMPPMSFVGLNGRVLDPALWRPFVIMEIEDWTNDGLLPGTAYNAQFWTKFLNFVQTTGIAIPNLANTLPNQVGAIIDAELVAARAQVTTNPTLFTPNNLQWFQNNGYIWAFLFSQYLGPGYVPPPGGNTQAAAGINVWNTVLAPGYPTVQDPIYSDFTSLTQAMRAKLQAIYSGLNIDFLIVGMDTIPTNVPVTHLYYVGNATGNGTLGMASDIDQGNIDQADFVGIFAGELGFDNAMFLGLGDPGALMTSSEVIEDLGFISCHELGHVLGLVHTNSQTDLMKRTAGTTEDFSASLGSAPIDSTMFPIGIQDEYMLLLQEVGIKP